VRENLLDKLNSHIRLRRHAKMAAMGKICEGGTMKREGLSPAEKDSAESLPFEKKQKRTARSKIHQEREVVTVDQERLMVMGERFGSEGEAVILQAKSPSPGGMAVAGGNKNRKKLLWRGAAGEERHPRNCADRERVPERECVPGKLAIVDSRGSRRKIPPS